MGKVHCGSADMYNVWENELYNSFSEEVLVGENYTKWYSSGLYFDITSAATGKVVATVWLSQDNLLDATIEYMKWKRV